MQGESIKKLRAAVSEREFKKWAALSYSGIGVRHFKSYPKANRFMSTKSGLSSSMDGGAEDELQLRQSGGRSGRVDDQQAQWHNQRRYAKLLCAVRTRRKAAAAVG